VRIFLEIEGFFPDGMSVWGTADRLGLFTTVIFQGSFYKHLKFKMKGAWPLACSPLRSEVRRAMKIMKTLKMMAGLGLLFSPSQAIALEVGGVRTYEWDERSQGWLNLSERSFFEEHSDHLFAGPPAVAAGRSTLKMLGSSAWSVVEKNRIQTSVRQESVSVLPQGMEGPWELKGWRSDASRHFKVQVRDGLGIEILTFIYQLQFQSQGRTSLEHEGGYLANVILVPLELSIKAMGVEFNASAQAMQAHNVGTENEPEAALRIYFMIELKGVLRSVLKTDIIDVFGRGQYGVHQKSAGSWR
jgi:hypothetical protein